MDRLWFPILWLYRSWYKVDTWLILRRINRDVPKLHEKLKRAGYNRSVRRRLLRNFIKDVQIGVEGVDLNNGK